MSENLRRPWHLVESNGVWFLVEINEDGGRHSLSFGASREDAQAELDRWTTIGPCRECGDPINDRWIPSVKAQVLATKLCHSCLHWSGYLRSKHDPTHVIIRGFHYVISLDKPKGFRGFLGHGGAEFLIRFHDGHEVTTHNLWAQGQIPMHFRDRLPDNAVFVQRGHVSIGSFAGYGGAGSADAEMEV